MASFAFYLGANALFAQAVLAFNCSIPPIYVDIHKRAVHDSPAFQYGSFIGLGTPAQNQSLWPSLSQNHTSFSSNTFCDNSTLKDCDRSTGGFYVKEDSSTFKPKGKDFQPLDKQNDSSRGLFASETVRLYTHYFETDGASQTLLEDVDIEVVVNSSTTPSIVGIGQASTILQGLVAQNKIAARTYSLYIGQGFDRAGGSVNGSNAFGGYDSGRFTGQAHSFSMNTANRNPFSVTVKDIIITETGNPNSNTSLFDAKKFPSAKQPSAFTAQITTDQYPLSLPYQITQNFIKHLDATKDNYWGDNSLKLRSQFNGTLSIVIAGDNGDFTVTLPQEVLVNASNITPIQDRTEASSAPFLLSTAFLSQVYLMADFETFKFYLAEAVQKNNIVMPETFCPKAVPSAYERPKQGAWMKQGLIGAVIGGVLGGIGIAICAYCFVLGCQRRRAEKRVERAIEKSKQSKMAQFEVEEVQSFDPPPKASKVLFWKRGKK
ncbi:acid protease [Aaosphaeria arxii CBS 175.79]|uniref:Acid protease n=1 Tax=Aaosphaeria arxii CBS 175.79 TaxID=1450172 RepID=A0A6A5Y6F8_9PLEO|nr:acid protease [Aaosphaeria arxii CBS 175.79]KAF2021155.1 acid protease [Aaosphaeria arxii CBS 175.79]